MCALLGTARETRFGTNYIMLGRLVEVKRELQKTVVDEKWEVWVERGDNKLKAGAETCKAAVMDDRCYTKAADLLSLAGWAFNTLTLPITQMCETLCGCDASQHSQASPKYSTRCRQLCRPILELLRMADADVPSIGKIYDACQRLHEHARTFPGLDTNRRRALTKLVRERWDMLHSDMHSAEYVLDPEFAEHNCTANQVCFCNSRQTSLGTLTALTMMQL